VGVRHSRTRPGSLAGLYGGTYMGRRVLVTGHTGFKGSWLALWLHELGAEVCGLALPPEPQQDHTARLGLPIDEALVDLRDAGAVHDALARARPEIVFHLAAQALVRRSYREPVATMTTNVMGLVHLLEAVRATPSVRAVVNATTDKCYAERHDALPRREDDPLGGHDPYSASKACAEIVSASWRASLLGRQVRLATARAGNVIGGGDWSEDRLVPDLVRAAVAGRPLRLRHPHAVRPWQHVLEPLAGYLLLGQLLLDGDDGSAEAWNFGPDADGHRSVGEVVEAFASHWPGVRVEHDSAPHPHENPRLELDCRKAHERLSWRPVWSLAETVGRTARWYRTWHERGDLSTRIDLNAYVRDARLARLDWACA